MSEDPTVHVPPPHELLARLSALPPAAALLPRLVDEPRVYLVGGAVRDLLLGTQPRELDLVVEGDAEALARRLGGMRRVHDRFGTCTVTLDGFSYDLARARRERYAQPGALPDVSPAALEEDLRRRDFTVNAIALALGGAQAGRIVAVPGALEDLDSRTLRVLHDRSFLDDPTRLLRMVRYAARLGFEPEPRTAQLARDALASGALRTVSGARIGTELRLLAREEDPVKALQALHELGVDAQLDPDFGLADPAPARRALALLPPEGRRDRLVLAAAARHVPAARLRGLLDRLAFEAGDRDEIERAALRAQALAQALQAARRPSEIASAVAEAGGSLEVVALAGALGAGAQARRWLQDLRHVALEIDGNDLLDAGVAHGPAVGAGLRAALAAKQDGRVAGREAELAEALRATEATG